MATLSAPASFRQIDGFDVHCLYAENDSLRREIDRLRISQLRRMAQLAEGKASRILLSAIHAYDEDDPRVDRAESISNRLHRFAKRCDNEIARLRGEG